MESVGRNVTPDSAREFMQSVFGKPMVDMYKIIANRTLRIAEYWDKKGNEDLAASLRNSVLGGKCVRCGRPWETVKIEGTNIQYYTPSCKCYPRCANCGHVQWEEKEGGLSTAVCSRCFHDARSGLLTRSMMRNKKAKEKDDGGQS